MKYRSFVAGLEAACKMAGYLCGPVRPCLDELRLRELKFPEKALALTGTKNEDDLRLRYDRARAEIQHRQVRFAALRKTIEDFDRKFPEKTILSWFIHKGLDENKKFLADYETFVDGRFEEKLKALGRKKKPVE